LGKNTLRPPRSPDGAQRNPGAASQTDEKSIGYRGNLDSAALHPDYKRQLPGKLTQSRYFVTSETGDTGKRGT